MKISKKRVLMKMVFSIIILVILISVANSYVHSDNKIIQGFLDLENWNFSEKGSLSLEGNWEFYPNLLSSELPLNDPNIIIKDAYVPRIWNNLEFHGEKIGQDAYGTYLLKIKLPVNETFYLKVF